MTNLSLGDTQAVGVNCVALWSVGFAEQFVGPIKPDDDAPIDLTTEGAEVPPPGRGKGKVAKTTPEAPDVNATPTEPPASE